MEEITLLVQENYDNGNESNRTTFDIFSGGWGYNIGLLEPAARFINVPIPAGSTIHSAIFSLNYKSIYYGNKQVNSRIRGILETNTATYSTATRPSLRPVTINFVDWDLTNEVVKDVWEDSPDITDIIQEIIDQDGWVKNNALGIYLIDNGTPQNSGQLRLFWTYYYEKIKCPKLTISYTAPVIDPLSLIANKNMPTGYHCFVSQFVKNLRAGYIPLETPDGVNRCW